ncbi:metalloprotease TIKI2-like protein, partial [Lates japonicus]
MAPPIIQTGCDVLHRIVFPALVIRSRSGVALGKTPQDVAKSPVGHGAGVVATYWHRISICRGRGSYCSCSIIFNHDTSQLPHFINSSLPAHDRMTAQQIDSYFRQELIYKRNERMARRVSALLQRNPNQTYFFAFGAGHFLGNHSVLDILRQEGYEIIHMPSVHQEPVTENKPAEEPVAGSSEESADTSTVSPTSWLTSPSEMELELEEPGNIPGLGDEELPHMLLPDSLSQLEEFGRHKRPRKAHRGHGRPRLFSDLWVRIGDGTTPPPN